MFNLMRPRFYIISKCQADLWPFIQGQTFWLPHTYLNIFIQKSLGCLMEYSLDCLGHSTKMAVAPIKQNMFII